jgi:hypothetical protein
LYYLELDPTLLQHATLVDGEADRESDFVVVGDFVVFHLAVICATAMLGGCRMREVPFYKGCARNEWYVVEVDYLVSSECCRTPLYGQLTLRCRSNFGCANVSPCSFGVLALAYSSVLGYCNRECLSRKCDGAAHGHCSPNACMLRREELKQGDTWR